MRNPYFRRPFFQNCRNYPVVVNGIPYPTIAEAAAVLGVDPALARRRFYSCHPDWDRWVFENHEAILAYLPKGRRLTSARQALLLADRDAVGFLIDGKHYLSYDRVLAEYPEAYTRYLRVGDPTGLWIALPFLDSKEVGSIRKKRKYQLKGKRYHTLREIADDFNVSPVTVGYWLKRERVETRNHGVVQIKLL